MQLQLNAIESSMRRYELGDTIGYQADDYQALFIGWSRPQPGWRWTECFDVEVIFGPVRLKDSSTILLDLMISSLTEQKITVRMNGVDVGSFDIRVPSTQSQRFGVSLDGSLLNETGLNRLGLHVPALTAQVGDAHTQGLRFTEFSLAEASSE